MHYLGSDIRGKPPEELAYGRKAGAQVVGSYDAIRWVPDAEVIPPGVDLAELQPAPPAERARPVIVHAPSSRRRKGTEHVIAACDGLDADLEIVEGLRHDEALERYRAADIVVDQLNAGWYGVFAIECMALGKPVVTFLHEEAVRRTEEAFGVEVPLVSATSGHAPRAAAAARGRRRRAPPYRSGVESATSSEFTTSSASPTACSISTLASSCMHFACDKVLRIAARRRYETFPTTSTAHSRPEPRRQACRSRSICSPSCDGARRVPTMEKFVERVRSREALIVFATGRPT